MSHCRWSWVGLTSIFTSSKRARTIAVCRFGTDDLINEKRVPLCDVSKAEGESIIYLDRFRRQLAVLRWIWRRSFRGATESKPVCIAGERRCPPEEVGGPSGYRKFLDVIFQPGHEEFEQLRKWAGGAFHAEEFDLVAVNEILERMRGHENWRCRKLTGAEITLSARAKVTCSCGRRFLTM